MRKERAVIIVVFLMAVFIALALHYTVEPSRCENYGCFQERMASCVRSDYINEEPEASWRYEIKREKSELCEIEVTLLQAKEGELKLREFEGQTMTCSYPAGVIAYPDKDLSRCHGLLKENLQVVIIDRLYSYLDNNLIDVKAGINVTKTI